MIYLGFDRPSFGLKTIGFPADLDPDAEIKALFAGGKQGAFYNPSDLSTMWQDAARTIPVTKHNDPVGCIDDLSGNANHAIQTVSASRPVYKTDGILRWLYFDGIDDRLVTALKFIPRSVSLGYELLSDMPYCVLSVNDNLGYNYFGGGSNNREFYVLPDKYSSGTWITIIKTAPYTKVVAVGGFMGTLKPIYINRVPAPPRTATGASMGSIIVGARYTQGTPDWFANLKLYSIVVSDSDFTYEELKSVESYSEVRTGVTL